MDVGGIGTILGYVLAALGTGVGGFFIARRRLSRDGVELTKDRSEIDIIDVLTKQRDNAVAAQDKLRADIDTYSEKRDAMKAELDTMKTEIEQLKRQLQLSEHLCRRLASTLEQTKIQLESLTKQHKKPSE